MRDCRQRRGTQITKAALSAIELAESTFYWHQRHGDAQQRRKKRDALVVKRVRQVIEEHPGYGWRRIKTELERRHGLEVNHKRLKRVLKTYDLAMPRRVAAKRKSAPSDLLEAFAGELNLVKGRQFSELCAFSTDFTELRYGNGAKAWLMAIVDIESRVVVGWSVAERRSRDLALEAWRMARDSIEAHGMTLHAESVVHHDKDSVYTSYRWLWELLIHDGIHVSFSERGAKDNPWIESVWSRMKLEWHSELSEARSLQALRTVLCEWFAYYNNRRAHSSLGNQAPLVWLARRLAQAAHG